jgi:hypothetical protein
LRRNVIFVLLAIGASACAARMFTPPSGPGVPANDAAAAWEAATAACRTVKSFAPTLRLSGRVAGARVPGLTVLAAVTAEGGLRLQATAASRTIFELAGTNERATFFYREENKFATARAEELVDALVGLKLGADALLPILSGCMTRETSMTGGERFEKRLAVSTASGRVFLQQEPAGWRAFYGDVRGLAVQYSWGKTPWPSEVVVGAHRGTPSEVQLKFRLDQESIVNPPLGPDTFSLQVPPSATPMSLDDLRALLRNR